MNARALVFVLFFAALMVAPRVVDPAYYMFLVAFAVLAGFQSEWHGVPLQPRAKVSASTALLACASAIIVVVILAKGPALRDLFRDLGALFAFFVGRRLFIAYRDEDLQIETLSALSTMGVMVTLVTAGAAVLAFLDGASAYIWRGEYVLWAHTWLPYALVANVALARIDQQRADRYTWCAVLCALGTIASLSRTDLLLEIGFGLTLVYRFRRELFLRLGGLVKLSVAAAMVVLVGVAMLQLAVVQQRIALGVGQNDQSLGWRFMENLALVDYFLKGTSVDALFGFGLGARLPLPPGIVDFNNNTSIPTLHNSFGTIVLKLGFMGLVILAWYLWSLARRSFAMRDLEGEPYRRAGRWIVLICLGKAMTLHGLTEWSHVVFFGIGCMLMLNRRAAYRVIPARAPTAGDTVPVQLSPGLNSR